MVSSMAEHQTQDLGVAGSTPVPPLERAVNRSRSRRESVRDKPEEGGHQFDLPRPVRSGSFEFGAQAPIPER